MGLVQDTCYECLPNLQPKTCQMVLRFGCALCASKEGSFPRRGVGASNPITCYRGLWERDPLECLHGNAGNCVWLGKAHALEKRLWGKHSFTMVKPLNVETWFDAHGFGRRSFSRPLLAACWRHVIDASAASPSRCNIGCNVCRDGQTCGKPSAKPQWHFLCDALASRH